MYTYKYIHQILTIYVLRKCSIFHTVQDIISMYEPASMHKKLTYFV